MDIADVSFTGPAQLGCWGPGDPEELIGKFYVYREGFVVGDDSSKPRTFYLQRSGHWRRRNDDGTFNGHDEAEKARTTASEDVDR